MECQRDWEEAGGARKWEKIPFPESQPGDSQGAAGQEEAELMLGEPGGAYLGDRVKLMSVSLVEISGV